MSSNAPYGKVFEDNLILAFKNSYKNKIEVTIGTEEDTFRGTDLKVNDMRVDVTANFGNKDHMKVLGSFQITKSFKINYGIRFGNNVKPFAEPVIVIGTDYEVSLVKEYETAIFNSIRKNIRDIYNDALFAYFKELNKNKVMT